MTQSRKLVMGSLVQKFFSNLCGVDKDTSEKGGLTDNLLKKQLDNVDVNKEEDVRKIVKVIGQMHQKAVNEDDN